jgi:hypothetical protein
MIQAGVIATQVLDLKMPKVGRVVSNLLRLNLVAQKLKSL